MARIGGYTNAAGEERRGERSKRKEIQVEGKGEKTKGEERGRRGEGKERRVEGEESAKREEKKMTAGCVTH